MITTVEFERMRDPHGPTGGKILRPSDGKLAKNVAFIQCAGSRDENHLRHCSRICCMASLKQTQYVRARRLARSAKSTIYYIDIRAIDRFEDFYQMVQRDPTVRFIKSKVARSPRTRRRATRSSRRRHRGLPALRDAATTSWCSRSEWSRAWRGADIPAEVLADSSGFIETAGDGSPRSSAPDARPTRSNANRFGDKDGHW
ncbi:MAG: hypothetical protein M5U07_18700 [Xanthobacteraceae bacterium]|nr:hypothetical protein [Xanthobacteraceae bacterium]